MTKFIIVRHGQSEANECGYLAGITETPLSSLGEKQAKAVSEYILKAYKVDVIYSSPLSRACNTVKGVADELNLPINTEDKLIEFNFGKWEGLTHEEIKNNFDDGYSKWARDPGVFIPDGGESMAQLQIRVVEKLKEIGKKEDGKTVLIGSHSSVIRALQCYIQGLPLTKMKNTPWVVNGSIAEINFDGEDFYIVKYGFDGHLINL
jgi:probable phosphoglycerate mutase